MRNPKKRRHAFLVLLLLLGITGIVFIGTDGFQIKEVTIVGNGKISKEDIIKRAGIPHNQNIFKLNKQLIKERLRRSPIGVLSIKRQYPNGVIITVKKGSGRGYSILKFLLCYRQGLLYNGNSRFFR